MDKLREALVARINNYFQMGGVFNPEQMDHIKVRDLLKDCREFLAAPSEPQASEPPDEVAWLIERDGPQWLFVAGNMLEWSSDSLRALRFSRKQDAEAF